jgi:hypothetical protein
MARIQEQDLLSFARGVVVSDIIFQFVKKEIETKLGDSFKKLGSRMFRKIAKEEAPRLKIAKKIKDNHPQFELLPFKISFYKGFAEAQFFIRSRNIEGEWGEQLKFFSALKKYLNINGDIDTGENGWSVKVILTSDYLPIQLEHYGGNGQKEFKTAGELSLHSIIK